LSRAVAWQTAEVAGPMKAQELTKPEVVPALVKRAKRPILIVGHEALDEGGDQPPIVYAIEIAKAGKVPVVATAHAIRGFLKRGFKPDSSMPAMDIANRLKDPSWKGLDGKGQYDLALLMGLPYYIEWVVLSGLKHFADNLKTVSLGRYYQPNATWSFPNIDQAEWIKNLKAIVNGLEGK